LRFQVKDQSTIEPLTNKIKRHFREVVQTKTSSRAIALGFSIGTFISILPTTGFGFLLGLVVVAIFKKVSKYGIFLAMMTWNPLTVAPLYLLSYQIGDWLIEKEAKLGLDWFEEILNHSKIFLSGNLIVNIPITLLSYFLIYFIVNFYKSKITSQKPS